jgi:hypothetical protein
MTEYAWIDKLTLALSFRRPEGLAWSPPTDAAFDQLAKALGATVPGEYRYFIEKYGGVILGDEDFAVKAPITEPCPWGQQVRPEIFYPLLQEHTYSLEDQLATYRDRIPHGVLPISEDAGGNQVCFDVAGQFSGSVWFWDHEQRWFKGNLQDAARELEAKGADKRRLSVHDIIRGWARLHADQLNRPADYMGMYRMAPSFTEFLRSLHRVSY